MIPTSEEFVTVVWMQLWQVTLLIVAVAVLARLFFRNKPHLAYLLWMLVVIKCLTPPLWSSPVGLFSWMQAEQTTQLAVVETAPIEPTEPMEFEMFDESVLVTDESVSEASVIIAEPMTLPEILFGVWLFGVVFLTVVVAVKWIQLHRKLKRTTIPLDVEFSSLVSRLKQKLSIRRPVHVLVTSEPVGPAVFGFLRPVIVLPKSLLDELSAEAIEPILAHELVHVRRFDSAAGLLQAVAQLLWWFHPLVWWANRQTSRERERCCDEEVVTDLGCLPRCYARSLLDVLELKRRLRPILAVPGIRRVEITSKRVEDIMQRSDQFHSRTPHWCWGVLLVVAALILPGARFVVESGAKSELPDKGHVPKKNKENDFAETKVSTKARPAVTVSKAAQTDSEDKAVAALKDLGARIRLDDQGRVIHVNLIGKGQITDSDLVHLKRLTELNNLQLSGPGITDAGLKNLRELAKLRRIWLVGTKITDAGLANLAGLTNLEILQFPRSRGITDKGLIHLKNLRKLKKLNLNAPGITDAGLKHLQGLSNLEHLGLDGTRISDAGLEELKDWKHLKELRLSYTLVTDAGLRHLRERTDLTSLNVGGPRITNEGLAHLKGLDNLYWLLIAGSQVTDAGLKHLSGLTDLQYLWIQKTQISDDGLAHLAGMNKLESLWLLDNAAITDAGLEHLKQLKNLKSVTLQGTKVTQAGVDKLKAALPDCKIAYP